MSTLKPVVVPDFYSPEECEFMKSFIDNYEITPEIIKKNENPLRLQLVNTPDPKIKEIALRTLAKVREISEDDSLMVGDFAPGRYLTPYASMTIHVDNNSDEERFYYSAVAYFNSDFEGGEIVFPYVNFAHKPKAGELVAFHSLHPHFVQPMRSGTRYLAASWYVRDRETAWDYLLG